MFATYPGGDCMGLKAYTVAVGKVRFLVVVYGLDGALKALIEADTMGSYRTGAASAVAARALARSGPVRVGLIGCGYQAKTQALALSRALEISELRVFCRDEARREDFVQERARTLGINVVAAANAQTAVDGADVVVTMTTSSDPVLEAGWVADGALVIGAGSNFANRAELPAELVARAKTIVVDRHAIKKSTPVVGIRMLGGNGGRSSRDATPRRPAGVRSVTNSRDCRTERKNFICRDLNFFRREV